MKREESPFFPGHEKLGLPIIEGIGERLKFSNEQIKYMMILTSYHMACMNYRDKGDKGVRRFLAKFPDRDLLSDLFLLQRADIRARDIYKDTNKHLAEMTDFEEKIQKIIEEEPPFTKGDLAINGHDIMEMGVKPSVYLGYIIGTLLNEVIDKPSLNTREYLLKRAKVLIG